jgi:hypothetical protein
MNTSPVGVVAGFGAVLLWALGTRGRGAHGGSRLRVERMWTHARAWLSRELSGLGTTVTGGAKTAQTTRGAR